EDGPHGGGPHDDRTPGSGREFGRRGGLRVWVGLSTMLGADRRPGELLGWGPIHAELAEQIAAGLRSWWCVLTDRAGAPAAIVPIHRRPRARAPGCPAGTQAGEAWLVVDPDTLARLQAGGGRLDPARARMLADIS